MGISPRRYTKTGLLKLRRYTKVQKGGALDVKKTGRALQVDCIKTRVESVYGFSA
jgi:hypothetical protein